MLKQPQGYVSGQAPGQPHGQAPSAPASQTATTIVSQSSAPRWLRPRQFEGLGSDERILLIRRPSALLLLHSAGSMLVLVGLLIAGGVWMFLGSPQAPQVPYAALAAAGILLTALLVVLFVRWLAKEVFPWLARFWVLTDQRLIEYSGVFRRARQQVP